MRYATRTGFDGQAISVGRVILTRRSDAEVGDIEPMQVIRVHEDDAFEAHSLRSGSLVSWSPRDYQYGLTAETVTHTLKQAHWCFPPMAKPEPREYKAILPSSDLA